MQIAGAIYQPAEIALMRSALDDAISELPIALQTSYYEAALAERILLHVAEGDRDGAKLKSMALNEFLRTQS